MKFLEMLVQKKDELKNKLYVFLVNELRKDELKRDAKIYYIKDEAVEKLKKAREDSEEDATIPGRKRFNSLREAVNALQKIAENKDDIISSDVMVEAVDKFKNDFNVNDLDKIVNCNKKNKNC